MSLPKLTNNKAVVMQEQHPIDQFFKQKLEHHKLKPSPAVWAKIASQSTNSKVGFPRMGIAAAILLLIGLSVATRWLQTTPASYQPRNAKSFVAAPVLEALDSNSLVAMVQERRSKILEIAPQTKRALKAQQQLTLPTDSVTAPVALDTFFDVAAEVSIPEASRKIVVVQMPDLTQKLPPPGTLKPSQRAAMAATDSAAFNLLDYSFAQLNNVVHGNKVEVPKNSKELLPEPIELAFDKVTAFFKSSKNN